MCPPHSPTRTTNTSILKLAGAFHGRKTSRIRFWAFSYSIGDPCERSYQLIMYFIDILLDQADSLKSGCCLDGPTAGWAARLRKLMSFASSPSEQVARSCGHGYP